MSIWDLKPNYVRIYLIAHQCSHYCDLTVHLKCARICTLARILHLIQVHKGENSSPTIHKPQLSYNQTELPALRAINKHTAYREREMGVKYLPERLHWKGPVNTRAAYRRKKYRPWIYQATGGIQLSKICPRGKGLPSLHRILLSLQHNPVHWLGSALVAIIHTYVYPCRKNDISNQELEGWPVDFDSLSKTPTEKCVKRNHKTQAPWQAIYLRLLPKILLQSSASG